MSKELQKIRRKERELYDDEVPSKPNRVQVNAVNKSVSSASRDNLNVVNSLYKQLKGLSDKSKWNDSNYQDANDILRFMEEYYPTLKSAKDTSGVISNLSNKVNTYKNK